VPDGPHLSEEMPDAAPWAPSLGLESIRSFLAAPMPPPPPGRPADEELEAQWGGEVGVPWGREVEMLSAAAPPAPPELPPPAPAPAPPPSEGGLGALMSQAKRRKRAGP
jgi:hypothetical protein